MEYIEGPKVFETITNEQAWPNHVLMLQAGTGMLHKSVFLIIEICFQCYRLMVSFLY
jgi:hypothetical protein